VHHKNLPDAYPEAMIDEVIKRFIEDEAPLAKFLATLSPA
jgi:hypothetical protein